MARRVIALVNDLRESERRGSPDPEHIEIFLRRFAISTPGELQEVANSKSACLVLRALASSISHITSALNMARSNVNKDKSVVLCPTCGLRFESQELIDQHFQMDHPDLLDQWKLVRTGHGRQCALIRGDTLIIRPLKGKNPVYVGTDYEVIEAGPTRRSSDRVTTMNAQSSDEQYVAIFTDAVAARLGRTMNETLDIASDTSRESTTPGKCNLATDEQRSCGWGSHGGSFEIGSSSRKTDSHSHGVPKRSRHRDDVSRSAKSSDSRRSKDSRRSDHTNARTGALKKLKSHAIIAVSDSSDSGSFKRASNPGLKSSSLSSASTEMQRDRCAANVPSVGARQHPHNDYNVTESDQPVNVGSRAVEDLSSVSDVPSETHPAYPPPGTLETASDEPDLTELMNSDFLG